jgi:hypothetical protein
MSAETQLDFHFFEIARASDIDTAQRKQLAYLLNGFHGF